MNKYLIFLVISINLWGCSTNKKNIIINSLNDSLHLYNNFDCVQYKTYSTLNDNSKNVILVSEQLPNSIKNDIIINFYNGKSDVFNKQYELIFEDITLYKLSNDWYVYIINYGSKEEHFSNIIGCFCKSNHYILKDAFSDICSELTLKSIDLEQKNIKVVLSEFYSCVEEQKEYYNVVFHATHENLKKDRILILDKSAKFDEAP